MMTTDRNAIPFASHVGASGRASARPTSPDSDGLRCCILKLSGQINRVAMQPADLGHFVRVLLNMQAETLSLLVAGGNRGGIVTTSPAPLLHSPKPQPLPPRSTFPHHPHLYSHPLLPLPPPPPPSSSPPTPPPTGGMYTVSKASLLFCLSCLQVAPRGLTSLGQNGILQSSLQLLKFPPPSATRFPTHGTSSFLATPHNTSVARVETRRSPASIDGLAKRRREPVAHEHHPLRGQLYIERLYDVGKEDERLHAGRGTERNGSETLTGRQAAVRRLSATLSFTPREPIAYIQTV
ncbi:unnamed protein product, partial [Protopolystoma xenopodis]